ncbi:hypothetical protein [Streptomyces sp. NPDC091259]|uniref:hypothetical protein n=1 Tax=Streptomyces sp. NPDC091259 TaxID=3365976 RepID=UPI0038065D61
MLTRDADLLTTHPAQTVIDDKGYISNTSMPSWPGTGLALLRPRHRNREPRPGKHLLKPIRQLIESVNDTLKGQLDLERHGARTPSRSPGLRESSPSDVGGKCPPGPEATNSVSTLPYRPLRT